MKKMHCKLIATAVTGALLLSGCNSIQQASSAMGSTGTGVLAGVAVGAGAGVLCDKLTNGKNSMECIAAGLAAGALAGYLAASLDEAAEKSVPVMDCASVKKRMAYPANATQPKAVMRLDTANSLLLVKPGEKPKITFKMDLATPTLNGAPQDIPLKISIDNQLSKANTKSCGGDYNLPVSLDSSTEQGPHYSQVKLLNAQDNTEIAGGTLNVCYTVASDGVNRCQ